MQLITAFGRRTLHCCVHTFDVRPRGVARAASHLRKAHGFRLALARAQVQRLLHPREGVRRPARAPQLALLGEDAPCS